MSSDDIRVEIKGLIPTPSGSGVFLTDGKKVIAIFVDPHIAASITMYIQGVNKPRPLTHDLIGNVLAGLGARAQKVVINDLMEDTFYARLFLFREDESGTNLIEIDARPSDSIAVALQQKCPIYVNAKVWEKTEDMSWALEQSMDEGESGDFNI
jgi:bifunctional DNase/RNase